MLRNRLSLTAIAAIAAALALVAAAPAAAQPACGSTITTNTTLTADLTCDDEGISIGAPGITLDLGGHTINGHLFAVRNDGYDDVTIRNGVAYSSNVPIALVGVTGNTIRDISLDGIVQGITVRDSDHNRLVSNRLRSAVLRLESSDHNVLRDNLLTAREGVIQLYQASDNRLVDNVVWTGDDTPLYLAESHRNRVRRNALITAQNTPLHVTGSNDNVFASNTFAEYYDYRGPGVLIDDSNRNAWRHNVLWGVPLGFSLASGAGNVFAANDLTGDATAIFDGERDGFFIAAPATETVVRDNRVSGFGDDGIDVRAPGTLIEGNSANDNGDLGIFAVGGAVDGGGNTASGNGNPQQCSGVVCN